MGQIENSRAVTPLSGSVAFGSVTGSNVTLVDTSNKRIAGMVVSSSLTGATSDCMLAIGGVDVLRIYTGMPPVFLPFVDVGSCPPGAIAVRHLGVAPTGGSLTVAAFPVR